MFFGLHFAPPFVTPKESDLGCNAQIEKPKMQVRHTEKPQGIISVHPLVIVFYKIMNFLCNRMPTNVFRLDILIHNLKITLGQLS